LHKKFYSKNVIELSKQGNIICFKSAGTASLGIQCSHEHYVKSHSTKDGIRFLWGGSYALLPVAWIFIYLAA